MVEFQITNSFNSTNKNVDILTEISRSSFGEILFGIPKETAWIKQPRFDGKMPALTYNNAQLLAILEHGSPATNMPPRPLLIPVIKKYSSQINTSLRKVIKLIINLKQDKAEEEMERLALRIQAWAQRFFVEDDNNWAPNAPATIKAKGSDRPMIDTGSLRKSVVAFYSKNGRRDIKVKR